MAKYKKPTYEEIEKAVAVLEYANTLKDINKTAAIAYENQLMALKWVLGLEKPFVHYDKDFFDDNENTEREDIGSSK